MVNVHFGLKKCKHLGENVLPELVSRPRGLV